jgi:hypothetical protein
VNNIKVKIDLRNRHNYQDIFIIVPLYDKQNGLINFPIDLEEWEVIDIYRFTCLYDKNKNEIYEKDSLYDQDGNRFTIIFNEINAQFLGDYGTSDFELSKWIVEKCELIRE